MPSTSIDTFFACTIIVAVALISTAFLASAMQTSINSAQNINKDSYLQAIADHIVASSGAPADWGTSSSPPSTFGLASASSTTPYELDIDKISRLNSLNNYSLSYFEVEQAAKLSSIALGITVSQLMSVTIQQTSDSTTGGTENFSFAVATSIESEPAGASLNCYILAGSSLSEVSCVTSDAGVGTLSIQVPSASAGSAMLIVFARADFDDRITSYDVYNFADSTQEQTPSIGELALTPLGNVLSLETNATDLTIQNSYVFSYAYNASLNSQGTDQFAIPNILDKSPQVIVVCGYADGAYFQQWTSYPQVPLKAGSSFSGSEQNVFSYTVTIHGALYKLQISLGDVNQ